MKASKLGNYRHLVTSVDCADQWRGSLIGNYGDKQSMDEEDERLALHDGMIRAAREGTKEYKRYRSALAKIAVHIGSGKVAREIAREALHWHKEKSK